MKHGLRTPYSAIALLPLLGACTNFGDGGGGTTECRPGHSCQICAAGDCDCVYGDYCETEDDCFVGCDTIGGCPTYHCTHFSGRSYGACTPESWPDEVCTSATMTCSPSEHLVHIGGADRCLDRCVTNADCTYCCGRVDDGTLVCAPDGSYCDGGGSGCPSGTAPMYPGGPCVSAPSSCPEGWAVCACPDYHGAWCHPDCDAYLRGEGGPGDYCSGTPC